MKGFHRTAIFTILMVFTAISTGAQSFDHVPVNSVAVVRIARMDSDPGVFWLNNAWLTADRESSLRDFLAGNSYQEAALSILPSDDPSEQQIAMIITLNSPPSKTKLNDMISGNGTVTTTTVGGITVTYVKDPATGLDFPAYAIDGKTVIFGNTPVAVESAIQSNSISDSANFLAMSNEIDTDSDGLLFADNNNARFADFLAPLEQKWQMSLLLSAQDLEWMASGFDVIDSNRIAGSIVFKGNSEDAVPDIADDAEFLGETFRRKFVAEKIDYSSDVSIKGTLVTLNFEISGLEPLWNRLFEQGVLSLIRPE